MVTESLPTQAVSGDEAAGRRSLIQAAIRLAARKRSFKALGLREVAREAGLNPNTFYRHFDDMEALAMTVATELGGQLSQTLKAIRASFPRSEAARATVAATYRFATDNPEAVIALVSELNSAYPRVRAHLRLLMRGVAQDIVDGVQDYARDSGIPNEPLTKLAYSLVEQLFIMSIDYIEQTDRRDEIEGWAVTLSKIYFTGGALLLGTRKN